MGDFDHPPCSAPGTVGVIIPAVQREIANDPRTYKPVGEAAA
jgi:hypothetical protein